MEPRRYGRLRMLLSKPPAEIASSVRWHIRNIVQGWISKVRFGIVSWAPKGILPCFLAYYPDSFASFPNRRDLYRRWIRGNGTNNGDASRFVALLLNLRQLQSEAIGGDCAEVGVWRGNSAAILADFAVKSGRRLFLFDTFTGFDERDFIGIDRNMRSGFADTSIDYVRQTVGCDTTTTYVEGFFPQSVTAEIAERRYALVHIDCDLYAPMKAALEFFYPRMPKGGMLILHDYSSGAWAGAKQAIDEFYRATGEHVSLWPDKSGTAMVRKSR
jgi:Macrocin-O-methyltransferase (TylF)